MHSLSVATAALSFSASLMPTTQNAARCPEIMMSSRKPGMASVKQLRGYTVGSRAPAGAVKSGTTKSRFMKNQFGKKKRSTVTDLKGYKVGSRAPPGAVSSGTTAALPRQSGLTTFSEGDQGVLPPLGVYDPLGLIGSRDMRRYEIMEIKHGRAAMLGFLHVLAIEGGAKIPTEECLAAPAGLLASLESMPTAGWLQIMLFCCMQETGAGNESSFFSLAKAQTEDSEAGDIAGIPWVRYEDDELKFFKLNAERQNGRAAMMGITGCLLHELLGVDPLYPTGGMAGGPPPTIF